MKPDQGYQSTVSYRWSSIVVNVAQAKLVSVIAGRPDCPSTGNAGYRMDSTVRQFGLAKEASRPWNLFWPAS